MTKGLVGGMTDYDHQSFEDILKDLNDEIKRTASFKNEIIENINVLKANSYWKTNVPFNFKSEVEYAVKHYNTTISEITDILKDIQYEVKKHHIKRLRKISKIARDINYGIGKIWYQEYEDKDYNNPNFIIVEHIYCDTRDMAVNLLDISNIAERLNDYIGKSNINNMKKNNPWISGSFYLVLALVVISVLGFLFNSVHWMSFPIIIIGGVLLIGLIGFLQLKNDDKITDKSFVSLIKEIYKRLLIINKDKQEE